jgi:hypothetical protein
MNVYGGLSTACYSEAGEMKEREEKRLPLFIYLEVASKQSCHHSEPYENKKSLCKKNTYIMSAA